MEEKNMQMRIFTGNAGTLSFHIQKDVNEFLSRQDIEVCDIKVSNSDSACVICIFYKPKYDSAAHWVWSEENGCWICSHCHLTALNNYRGNSADSNYCPHCGAKMHPHNQGFPGKEDASHEADFI